MTAAEYDAFLLVSFGGPEGPQDVIPFLENVTRGRGIPRERLAAVGEHYYRFGGISPINQQCRDLIAAVTADFAAHDLRLPIYWGNRNWDPLLTDTVRRMASDGVRRAVAFVTSAYSSYSSCRQYLDDIARARAEVGAGAPEIDKLRIYFNHPGFVEPLADHTRAALATLPASVRPDAHLVFTAHSIPVAMAETSGPASPEGAGSTVAAAAGGGVYATQLAAASRLVNERVDGGTHPWWLVYQSRSGPPGQPWLGPDVRDHLETLAGDGVPAVVLVPVGFVSDHMEVKYDLDVEAARTAERLGLPVARAATAGTHPRFVAMVRELICERIKEGAKRPALGNLPANHDTCPAGCCAYSRRVSAPAASSDPQRQPSA